MGRAHARAPRVDEYLSVPRRGRPDLRVVEGGAAEPAFAPAPVPRPAPRTLRPDWLPADLELPEDLAARRPPRRDLAEAPPPQRRTVVVAGRPADAPVARISSPRKRRSPTAARLAGRPDRVAGWAVLLGVIMAVMAGVSAGGEAETDPAAAPVSPALTR